MKKQVIPALLLLMGMLSSLGVFLFAFPFWDAVLWMLYIPVLLFAVVVYNRLLLRRRKKVILILAGGMLLLGVLSFSLLQEGAHIAYNIITEVYHDASGYVFYPYDVTDTAMLAAAVCEHMAVLRYADLLEYASLFCVIYALLSPGVFYTALSDTDSLAVCRFAYHILVYAASLAQRSDRRTWGICTAECFRIKRDLRAAYLFYLAAGYL